MKYFQEIEIYTATCTTCGKSQNGIDLQYMALWTYKHRERTKQFHNRFVLTVETLVIEVTNTAHGCA